MAGMCFARLGLGFKMADSTPDALFCKPQMFGQSLPGSGYEKQPSQLQLKRVKCRKRLEKELYA
jgi:hypothetical protein